MTEINLRFIGGNANGQMKNIDNYEEPIDPFAVPCCRKAGTPYRRYFSISLEYHFATEIQTWFMIPSDTGPLRRWFHARKAKGQCFALLYLLLDTRY